VLGLGGCATLDLFGSGGARELRDGQADAVPDGEPAILVLAFDGVGRAVLYPQLARGELPELAQLLGGASEETPSELPHAYLDDTILSVLPSSTLAAWSSIFTGATPAAHGVAGNEYFVRESRRFAAPAPVSVDSVQHVLETYSDGYVNQLLAVPTIYERLRERDPGFTAWVSMSQIYRGADRLLLTDGSVVGDAFAAAIASAFVDDEDITFYAQLDRNAVENVVIELGRAPAPRMLTVYLPGIDLYAHGAVAGPDAAVRRYLIEVVDPLMGELRRALQQAHALEDRYVVLVSDHGHTAVVHDDAHALSTDDGEDDPPAVVRSAGYRLRPFELEVPDETVFDAVLAYGGAMAYVYVADRSHCPPRPRERVVIEHDLTQCDWTLPARYEEDILPMAEAFFRASADGLHAPGMRGTLDLVLVRRSTPIGDDATAFQVYLGDRRTEPVAEHLAAHPREQYVAVESRLEDLAVGRRGHHAGDVLLLARNGNQEFAANRYYFAAPHRSGHGSPSRADSEIPLIIAHPVEPSASLRRRARRALGERPSQTDIARLIESLLYPE